MSLWRLASSSLLLSSAKSFVVPLTPISQHATPTTALTVGRRRDVWGSAVPPRAAAAPRGATHSGHLSAAAEDDDAELESDEFMGQDGPRLPLDDPVDMPEPAAAAGARDPLGDLDALDDLLGVHSSDPSSSLSGGQSTLDALDDLLRRDAVTMQGSASSSSSPQGGRADSGGALVDDGFGALDDLLGLDDGALLPPPAGTGAANAQPSSTRDGGGTTSENPNPNLAAIDPFADFKTPGRRDSLDELLSQSLPSAPEPVARQRKPRPGVADQQESASAGMGAGDPDSWLDDLLKLDSDDFSSDRGGATASNADVTRAGGRGGGRRGANARVLESLIDEVSSASGGAAPGVGKSANTNAKTNTDIDADIDADSGSVRRPASESAAADAPAAIDDWLNDLLEENEGASKPSPVRDQPGVARGKAAADPRSGVARDNANDSVDDNDPWGFEVGGGEGGGDAGTGGGGGYGDVITGSNQLEGWKANMEAPRSNVMGRAKSADAPPGDTRQRGFQETDEYQGERGEEGGWKQEPERGYSRGSDWGEGGGWGDEGGRGLNEWERGGMRSAARSGAGAKILDKTEAAQRATTADLVALGKKGRWEDVLRALVGARVRGVPVNVQMYNR